LVSDFLVRDLRDSGLFKAVFSYRDSQTGRFSLEGGVERFLELDAKNGSKAVLSLNATLLDLSQGLVSRRVVFQRWYRAEAPLAQANARALAKGMSRAMAEISGRLTNDVYRAMAAAEPLSKRP
jgi:cholesterol transport system auxiliary component